MVPFIMEMRLDEAIKALRARANNEAMTYLNAANQALMKLNVR